jgi:hypothetical protein
MALPGKFGAVAKLQGQIQGEAAGWLKVEPKSFEDLKKKLTEVQRDQIPFATALALTRTAARVKAAEIAWMQGGIDRGATPWTLRSLYLKRAEKKALGKGARVWFIDGADRGTPAGEYLKPQVHGGGREPKRGEKAIRSRHKLANGRFLVPGRYVPLNAYGNIKGGPATMQKILANIRGGRDALTDTKKGKTSFFQGVPKGRSGPAGIWERRGKKLRLFFVETGQPQYKAKFDFFGIADNIVGKYYDYEFAQALSYAIRSAK